MKNTTTIDTTNTAQASIALTELDPTEHARLVEVAGQMVEIMKKCYVPAVIIAAPDEADDRGRILIFPVKQPSKP